MKKILLECPCCGYASLKERGAYNICKACFWEDDGTNEADAFSNANRRTLREGRDSFELIGSCSEGSRQFVDKDAKKKYIFVGSFKRN